MGNKASRQEKALLPSALRIGSSYKTIWSPDVGSDYLGKLTKKSKNKDGSYSLTFEMGFSPFAKGAHYIKTKHQTRESERHRKQTRKREGLLKEMKACVKAKCSAEQAADQKYRLL